MLKCLFSDYYHIQACSFAVMLVVLQYHVCNVTSWHVANSDLTQVCCQTPWPTIFRFVVIGNKYCDQLSNKPSVKQHTVITTRVTNNSIKPHNQPDNNIMEHYCNKCKITRECASFNLDDEHFSIYKCTGCLNHHICKVHCCGKIYNLGTRRYCKPPIHQHMKACLKKSGWKMNSNGCIWQKKNATKRPMINLPNTPLNNHSSDVLSLEEDANFGCSVEMDSDDNYCNYDTKSNATSLLGHDFPNFGYAYHWCILPSGLSIIPWEWN